MLGKRFSFYCFKAISSYFYPLTVQCIIKSLKKLFPATGQGKPLKQTAIAGSSAVIKLKNVFGVKPQTPAGSAFQSSAYEILFQLRFMILFEPFRA